MWNIIGGIPVCAIGEDDDDDDEEDGEDETPRDDDDDDELVTWGAVELELLELTAGN